MTTVVLVAASMLAGRGSAVYPTAGTVSLEARSGSAVADRPVHVPTVSVGEALVRHTKGTPRLPPAALAHLDIPVTALLAYQRAAAIMENVDGSCGLSWSLLAAVGRVESDHGRYGGALLGADGVSSPVVRGVALDGRRPVARVHDTDGGGLDGDRVWDRAVGPMQFLPSTWSVVAVDADGDGIRSPDDIDDASLAAAVFLCSAPGSLDTRSGRGAAVFRYNPSGSYVASVLAVDRAYRAGDFAMLGDLGQPVRTAIIPASPEQPTLEARRGADHGDSPSGGQVTEAGSALGTHDPGPTSVPSQDPTHGSTPGSPGSPDPGTTGTPTTGTADPTSDPPSPTPSPTSDPPSPTPDPSSPTSDPPSPTPDPSSPTSDPPSPTPDPPSPTPEPVTLTGVLGTYGVGPAQWCVGETVLDVGDADFLTTAASADFDGDGTLESNAQELTGLVGTQVSLQVTRGTAPAVVLAVNGADYDPTR
ncbi:lytic transglycosylase domain-containing protein [Nocardioides koreensis]|uniref:lytic transglycosylase domain-containing protein n=1 Tax=Nocardioides koreensis TaxID=433651 RepID=UPI0031D9DADD